MVGGTLGGVWKRGMVEELWQREYNGILKVVTIHLVTPNPANNFEIRIHFLWDTLYSS